jgi:hypothetical protein
MPNIKNNKNKYKIGLKEVSGSLIGLKYFKSGEAGDFTRIETGAAHAADFSAGIENAKKIFLILPPEIVSYKFLSYPFKLKNKKNTELLVKTSLEELTPLDAGELVILKHKLTESGLFIEYAKKNSVVDLLDKFALLNIKRNIEIYFPYSLLYKISDDLITANGNEDYASIYSFAEESYGAVIKSGTLAEIIDLKLTKEFSNGRYLKNSNSAVYDLTGKAVEIFGRPPINYAGISSGISNISADMSDYADLMFLLAKESGKNGLPHLNSDGILNKTGGSAILKNAVPVISLAFISLIIAVFLLAENYYYKNSEKNILENKINSVLSKYMPRQKVFYEPRYEIKRYYDTLEENSGGGEGGGDFLKFLKYISEEKENLKGLTVNGIDYSYNKFTFKGAVKGYKNLDELESFLKKRYSAVDVIKSYKNSEGFVKFDMSVKKR